MADKYTAVEHETPVKAEILECKPLEGKSPDNQSLEVSILH